MLTLNEISERIAYALNEPLNYILKENIKFSVKYWRALLIRRDVATNGMSNSFLQRFYMDLIKVDKADACNFNLDCVTVLRTKNPIPTPVRLKSDSLFKFIGTVDGKSFPEVEYEEIPYTCYNKFTNNSIRFSYINNYIYVFNNTKLKKLALQYIVEFPETINNFCTEDSCYNDDMPFPCPADLVQQIINGILSSEFKILNPNDEEVKIDVDKK
jgi:hypothetical protein